MRPTLDFWYEFASSYSYLAAVRIEGLARERNIDIAWRPFLLGPIFKSQGWDSSPFNLYPAKGAYMWRDLERLCDAQGLKFRKPDPFPQSSLMAARMALTDEVAPCRAEFSRRVFLAQFADGPASMMTRYSAPLPRVWVSMGPRFSTLRAARRSNCDCAGRPMKPFA
jgi:2-hydroxychromene-2-carboxylate isomerase